MKKYFTILSIVLLGAVACTKETDRLLENPMQDDGPKVAVTMSVRLPVELMANTRSNTVGTNANKRGEQPIIESIRVAVFGTSGYTQAYELAQPMDRIEEGGNVHYEPTDHYATTNNELYYFKVLLPVYEGEAHVHIVANGPETIRWADEDEFSIMSQMYTTDNVGGYWARVVLEDGILADLSDDGIMVTDEDGNYVPSNETAALFKDLVLVRNFAEITLRVEEGAGIRNVTWTLVNDPTYGSFAPMADGLFVDDYKDYVYDVKTGKMVNCDIELDENGKPVLDDNGQPIPIRDTDGNIENVHATYNGYMVRSDLNTTIPAGSAITTSTSTPLFTYERLDPNKTNPTYIMMKAQYGDEDEYTYYRVDLMDEALGGYFPLYRNYKYQIKIHKVGNRGATTPEDAALRNSGGNVSMSAETKTLTDVSDGFSRLFVEYVEKTFTSGGQKSFWVYYIPDLSVDEDNDGNADVDNSSIDVRVKEIGTALANATITQDETKSTRTGKYFYTVTLNGQSESDDLESVLEVSANNGKTGEDKSTLYRDITLKVMKKMDMHLSLEPRKLAEGTEETTVLHIALTDTLQASMFPLEFYIEDTNRTLNPTGYDGSNPKKTIAVPVKTGPSIYNPADANSYAFIRTVNWSEYEPMRDAWVDALEAGEETDGIIDFTTEFVTIKSASKTTVYVDNEYFNMDSVVLFNDAIDVSVSNSTVAFNETSVTIKIQTEPTTTTWTAAGGSSAVTLSQTSGTGDATITMSFPENQSFGTDNTYTATITSGGKDYVVTVVQMARSFNVSASATHVAYDVTSVEVEIVAEDNLEWVASVDNGAGLVVTRAAGATSVPGTGSHTLTVDFDENNGTAVKTYTVTVVPAGDATQAKSVVITQGVPTQSPYTFKASAITFPSSGNNRYTSNVSNSPDGYVSIRFTQSSKSGSGDNAYITVGRSNNDGTITITPNNGMIITGIKVTYTNPTYAGYDSGATVNTGIYRIDQTHGIGTWTGESSGAVTISNSHNTSWTTTNYPRVSSVEVTYF
jgi:hypothetical protein